MTRRILVVIAIASALGRLALGAVEPVFVPVKIDGPAHDPAKHTYWFGPFCECCSAADFNGDGQLDIAAGRNWYEAPDWKKHENFRDGAETNGPETDDNSEFAMDVNRDGRPDIVSSGWMRMKGAFWYENPGPEGLRAGAKWKAHRIHSAKNMEGVIHGDMDGDGDDDVLCNHWAPVEGQGMTWLEHIDREPWFVERVIGAEGEFHGNGLGDINGDGRVDIVTPTGWYEAPANRAEDQWVFHADYTAHPLDDPQGRTAASHPMLVHDCNGDGKNDIIVGVSHAYGLAWLEQVVDASGKRGFRQHWIEKDFGQCHTMDLGDLNGDGKLDFVTGKRLFAHHGRDISCYDPLFGFWYEIQGGQFQRHVLYFNHLPWYPGEKNINPPPNGAVSMGMKVIIVDMNKDGRNDIVVPGKAGLYLFYNIADAPRPKLPMRTPPEETYPSWTPWHDKQSFTLQPDQHGMVLKTPDGRTVFRYMTKKPADTKLTANSVCCLYPVKTPSGEDAVEFAPSDHPHHRGVFLAWHAMDGKTPADFWGWGQWAPTEGRVIQNREVKLLKADSQTAEIAVRNDWMADGETLIKESATIAARQEQDAYVIDLDYRLTPSGDVTLKQTAFGGFCAKCRKDGKAAYFHPQGEVNLPPPHHLKPQTDWPAADWYDYVIELDAGKTIGVAVLDHPHNPASLWHNLKPIAMVNPCVVAPGPVTLQSGQPLRLRYRLVTHDGPAPTELLKRLAKQWRSE